MKTAHTSQDLAFQAISFALGALLDSAPQASLDALGSALRSAHRARKAALDPHPPQTPGKRAHTMAKRNEIVTLTPSEAASGLRALGLEPSATVYCITSWRKDRPHTRRYFLATGGEIAEVTRQVAAILERPLSRDGAMVWGEAFETQRHAIRALSQAVFGDMHALLHSALLKRALSPIHC